MTRWPQPTTVAATDMALENAANPTMNENKADSHSPHMLERITAAALAVSRAGGDTVFADLARNLAQLLAVDATLIAVGVEGDTSAPGNGLGRMRTLAVWLDGELLENLEYDVEVTPCRKVIGHDARFVASGVHSEFASDTMFSQLGFDSYAARSLLDDNDVQIGLVAALHRKPLADRELTEALLHIFASRAAAEVLRQRAQAALWASQQDYRAIFDAAEDAIFVHDHDTGSIVDVNPKASEMFGWSCEEMRKLGVSDISSGVPPYTATHAAFWFAKAKRGENPRFEWHGRNKGGRLQWVEVSLKSAAIGGKPHIIAVAREITARKMAEEALRASEEQYRAIFNASVDGLLLEDADHGIVDVNQAYLSMHGHEREGLIGRRLSAFVPAELQTRCEILLPEILAGKPCHLEARSQRRDGTTFDVEIHGVPMQYQGRVHALIIMRDITEAKRAEEALRASEEQYRTIFNASADALVLRDADFRIVDVNHTWERMSGYRRTEVLSLDRIITNPPEVAAVIRELHERALHGESVLLETRIARRDALGREVELRGVPVRYRGQPHVLWVGRDITERKRAEEDRALLESRLRQAQKMEAIGQLTGGIAHDFNNILTSIVGYIALATEREMVGADPKLARYLQQAEQSCHRARDLIQQMLTFSRGQRGERRCIILSALVRESAQLLQAMLPASLELRVEASDNAAITADPVQIEQVLLNLCINARDAIGGVGQMHVTVRERQVRECLCASCRERVTGRYIDLSVTDNGPGIAPEVLERIFEPFFSTKEVGKGTGMGLAVVHGIVHEHGGHVCVDSVPGRGTTFHVLLPIAEGIDASIPGVASGLVPARPVALRGRVLLVDDQRAVLAFMHELLETWGLGVTPCTSAAEALEALDHGGDEYALAITDQTMPRMTGLQLAAEIARRRPALPVVLYTGYAEGLPDDGVQVAGVRAVVRKPIDPAALRSVIAPLLRG